MCLIGDLVPGKSVLKRIKLVTIFV